MNQASSATPSPAGTAGRWLWILGAAGVVCAARLGEIHLHSGDTPFLDQWDAEAGQILVPWLDGKLSWHAFFAPHNEHVPAWTRLVSWLQAALLGRWDPQLQMTFNAGLHGLFAGVLAGWLRRALPRGPAVSFTLLVVVLGSLPFSWENSTWGFQTHTPLALLFVFLHIRGSFGSAPGSAAWWWAQGAGLAALFTYGSMWAAPAAVMLAALWTGAPDRRRWIAPAVLTAAGIGLLISARSQQDPATSLALAAHSPREFLADFLLQLGWPAVWPGACVVLGLPAFLLALQIRRRARAEALDCIVVALAVWAAAQAAAFAYGRGGNYIGFVSRYGDLLALGVTANGIALWRLAQAARAGRAGAAAVLALVWLATVTQGLELISTRGHTEYFHERSEQWAHVRHNAVQDYLATKDISVLSTEEARKVLYPNPAVVAQVLDHPGLAALLPFSLRPDPAPTNGDFLGELAERVRANWAALLATGMLVLLLGFWLASPAAPAPALVLVSDPWQVRLAVGLAVASIGLVLLWPHPLEFGGADPTRVGHDSLAIIALVAALLGAVTAARSRRPNS